MSGVEADWQGMYEAQKIRIQLLEQEVEKYKHWYHEESKKTSEYLRYKTAFEVLIEEWKK